ncbi:hypothetical protein NN3_35910 [Nocardia neocaledoniensis NBRC 108232]|uniref:Uncharacterized protein n=1 Tax=Nocardia neocaledoniensis TaxID=236511 RepID=A0A317NCV0_9NOCA|nr:hypothetical protein DFR69_10852 [Nocardia neocaledoniensis]GEM32584.1 hypothetical protein NN3_35910 [Nocardia neocaledoniensis NBRC 108232]
MPRGIPRHVKGERVRIALVDARPNGLSAKRLADVTGLSPSQVRDGLVEIREESALAHGEPLVWSRANGYQLSEDPDAVRTYTGAIANAIHKRLIRLLKGTVLPFARMLPGGPWVDNAIAQLNAAIASLQMAIDITSATSAGAAQRSPTAKVAH